MSESRKRFEEWWDSQYINRGTGMHMAEKGWTARDAEVAELVAALDDLISGRETVGAGASIFQCTTEKINAARALLSKRRPAS